MAGRLKLEEICRGKRLIITLGPGGVGKTTLAALLGLESACLERRALVLTVDPALRLADALGMRQLQPGRRSQLSRAQLARAGFPAGRPLEVCLLDTGTSLAAAVSRQLPPGAEREKILHHPFFERLRRDLAGAREYAAVEETVHLLEQPELDLVVVDTPPSNHALDFLDAPEKLLEVIDSQAWRWLMRPALLAGQAGLAALDFVSGYLVRTMARFTGTEFLKELAGFIDLLSGLVDGFRRRAAEFSRLVRSPDCALALVTCAEERPMEETLRLRRALLARGLEPQLVLANRLVPRPAPAPAQESWRRELLRWLQREGGASAELAESTLRRMEEANRFQAELARRQEALLLKMRSALGEDCPLVEVPLLARDVCDLESLAELHRTLFGAGPGKEER